MILPLLAASAFGAGDVGSSINFPGGEALAVPAGVEIDLTVAEGPSVFLVMIPKDKRYADELLSITVVPTEIAAEIPRASKAGYTKSATSAPLFIGGRSVAVERWNGTDVHAGSVFEEATIVEGRYSLRFTWTQTPTAFGRPTDLLRKSLDKAWRWR